LNSTLKDAPRAIAVNQRKSARRTGRVPEAALSASDRGWVVVALRPGTKSPIEKWKYLKHRNREQLEAAWPARKCAVGIVTGPSGLVVIDVDGPVGAVNFSNKVRKGYKLPATTTLATPGGKHRIFQAGEHQFKTCGGEVAPGIDIRAIGGMEKIWDPQEVETRYFLDDRDPVPIPAWLAALLPLYGAARVRDDGSAVTGRQPLAALERDCLEAAEGQQRGVLLQYVLEAQKSFGDKGAVEAAFQLSQRMPQYKPRQPWTRNHIVGLLREAVTPDATDEEAALLASLATPAPERAARLSRIERQAYSRERARRRAKQLCDAEDLANAGDPSLFEPVNLLDVEDPPPLQLGAEGVFPLGAVSSLIGTHNTGKSPLLGFTGLARIRAGWDEKEMFGVYELEMGTVKFKRMLRELGATDEEISRFKYYSNMLRPIDLVRNGRALCERARADGCLTIGYDSLISMLAVSQLDENNPVQVRNWFDAAARPMVLLGGSTIVADHTGLGDPERGRGTSDKDRAVDFVTVMRVVAGRVGKRGVSGEYELKCTKDRDARFIGNTMKLEHEAFSNGQFSYHPHGWEDELAGIGDGFTQSRIASRMREIGRPVGPTELSEDLGLSSEAVRSALKRGTTGSEPMFVKVGRGKYENRSADRSG
jgi:hypothetical protein